MMVKNLYLILSLLLLIQAQAQECGTDEIQHAQMQSNPEYAAMVQTLENQLQDRISAQSENRMDDAILYIPIVVHVIHTGEAIGTGNNISNNQILNTIRGMNTRFRNLNGLGINIGIQFCLTRSEIVKECRRVQKLKV